VWARSLTDTGVTAGTYGDAAHVGQFTVDAQGRISAAASVAVSGGGGSGGVLTLISEVVTSASQASVTFSSIPATYRDLVLVVRGRMTGAVTSENVHIQFNSDTAANYNFEFMQATSSFETNNQFVGQTFLIGGQLPGASATASHAGFSRILIGDYRGTTFFKELVAEFAASLGTGASSQGVGLHGGSWISTAAINAIKVFLGSGNFVDGDVVSLYGSM
jgi:hypothetical protein